MQSSARQRMKQLKCKCKPTWMEGSVSPRTRGAGVEQRHCPSLRRGRSEAGAWGLSLVARARAAAHGGTRLLPRSRRDAEPTKRFLKVTSTRANVCQDNTVLASQELLPSRNAVGCCKGE